MFGGVEHSQSGDHKFAKLGGCIEGCGEAGVHCNVKVVGEIELCVNFFDEF